MEQLLQCQFDPSPKRRRLWDKTLQENKMCQLAPFIRPLPANYRKRSYSRKFAETYKSGFGKFARRSFTQSSMLSIPPP